GLSGLTAGTAYHFAAQSVNAGNAVGTSGDMTFTTATGGSGPPPSTANTVTVQETSGNTQNNRPVSISRVFVQGEIPGFAQAVVGSTPVLTQCDVKNRWPDGSLKFAIVSFVMPSIPAKGTVTVSFSNQTSNGTTGYLAKSDMLAPAYNFDGQIQLTGAASHHISARSILTAADSCNDPGNDIDAGRFVCTYWLKGPI